MKEERTRYNISAVLIFNKFDEQSNITSLPSLLLICDFFFLFGNRKNMRASSSFTTIKVSSSFDVITRNDDDDGGGWYSSVVFYSFVPSLDNDLYNESWMLSLLRQVFRLTFQCRRKHIIIIAWCGILRQNTLRKF